jgi:hypothetical protein
LQGAPVIVEAPVGRYAQTAPESARRAILLCAPYNQLPPEKYDEWREMRMTFFPIDMLAR